MPACDVLIVAPEFATDSMPVLNWPSTMLTLSTIVPIEAYPTSEPMNNAPWLLSAILIVTFAKLKSLNSASEEYPTSPTKAVDADWIFTL